MPTGASATHRKVNSKSSLAVRANSYSRSVTGQNLFGGVVDRALTLVEGVVTPRSGPTPKSSAT